jgi:Ras family
VGNKCDLSAERRVDTSEGKQLAAQYNIPFLEVSAKENLLISEVFQTLGKGIKERLIKEEKQDNDEQQN